MNELALLSNDELDVEVKNIERRASQLKTIDGQKRAAALMLETLRLIEAAGYSPKTDLAEMAMSWVIIMREQIAVYQFKGIREAVIEFIKNDTREYKQFPSVGQIIDICNHIGKNPKVELSRRRQKEFERMVDEEYDREMAALPEEYKRACMRKYEHLWKKES